MSDAPATISAQIERVGDFAYLQTISGVPPMTEFSANYRRADIPWLPEELVARLGQLDDGEPTDWYTLLRDILHAVEPKE